MVESVRALRAQLVELERVSQLCSEYIARYTGQLRERLLSHGELFERTTGYASSSPGGFTTAQGMSSSTAFRTIVLDAQLLPGEGHSTKAERARVWMRDVGWCEWNSSGNSERNIEAGEKELEIQSSPILWETGKLLKSTNKKVWKRTGHIFRDYNLVF